MPANDIVARNLKRLRAENELSLGVLAARSGLAKQTILSIESGRSNPTVDTLERLADALGIGIRALVTELGSEILLQPAASIHWQDQGGVDVRMLDQAFGSGYVLNAVVRLEAARGVFRPRPGSRGSLRHCYALEGVLRLGPDAAPVTVSAGDFVRFPADAAHVFEAHTPVALVLVCTTTPQLSMTGGARIF